MNLLDAARVPDRAPEPARLLLRGGRLHIPAAVYGRILAGCPNLALMVRDGDWWLLPLRGGAGGLAIKIRNPQGDRIVESQEFFRSQGVDDMDPARYFEPVFDAKKGAYRLQDWP